MQSWVLKSYQEISLKLRNQKERNSSITSETNSYKKKIKSVYFMVPKLRLSFCNSFFVSLEFIDLVRNYVVIRTSLQFQGLPMQHVHDTDSLNLVYGFLGMLWQSFYPLLSKDRRIFVSPQVKSLHSQYNTLGGLTYYKQSYCKDK